MRATSMSVTNYIEDEMCDVNKTCVSDKVDFMIKQNSNSGINFHIFKYYFVINV